MPKSEDAASIVYPTVISFSEMRDRYTLVIKSLPSVTDLAVSNVLASDAKFRNGSSSESCIIKRYFGGPFASTLLIVAFGAANPATVNSRTIS